MTANTKYHLSRYINRAITKKRNPTRLEDISLEQKLAIVLSNRKAAKSIMAYCQNNLAALNDVDHEELATLDGVGEGNALKMLMLFELLNQLR